MKSTPRAGIVVIVVAVASCALPDAAEFNKSSSVDPGDAGASGDGGGSSSSGGLDGGADAGDGGSIPSGAAGCAAHPSAIFCADFDGNPYDNGFDDNGANGRVASDATTAVSLPRSLVASLPSRATGMSNSYLEHFLDGSIISFRLSWAAKLEDDGVQSAVDFGVSISRNTPAYHSLQLRYVHASGSAPYFQLFEYADVQGANPQVVDFTAIAPLPKIGQFQHWEMRITQSASASSVTLLLDGAMVVSDHPLTFHRADGPTRILAGIGGSDGPGDPVVAHVDDVVVEPP